MAPSPVAHLHNHTTYSLVDGAQKLGEMCETAVADGQPAIAITDHGHPGGAWKFAAAAHKAGIKPIIGMEAYLAIGSRHERNFETVPREAEEAETDAEDESSGKNGVAEKRKNYQHLTLLVETPQGWSSLVSASNKSQDSVWYKPRLDFELLAEHAEGLIVLTGCLGGPVASYLLQDRPEQAEANLRTLIDNHGAGNVYVEVMDHGLPAERKVTAGLIALARKYNLPVVATNDAHYTFPNQADAHECWLCIGQYPKKMSDSKRFKFRGTGYHLRTAAEMHALFDDQPGTEQAVQNTLLIAERIHPNVLPEARLRLPNFPCPDGMTTAQYLHQLTREGAHRRYGLRLSTEVKTRLRFEEDAIVAAGLDPYMLIVWDIIRATREAGHRVGYGRGSAAGCAISYCLGITGLDPIRYNLLFERFINPDRAGMPDIDTDFDSAGREFAIRYTIDKYGPDVVAKIGTYGMALSKRAIKDVARVTSVPQTGDKLARQIPSVAGKPLPLAKLLDASNSLGEPFRNVLQSDPYALDVVETARAIEGVVREEGIHACGVLIGDGPLTGFVPMRYEVKKVGGKNVSTGIRVTQWDGKDVDALGLLKKDFLALRNLDVVTKAVQMIADTTGEHIDTEALPDPADLSNPRVRAAYQLLAQGKTAGVFQLESAGITKLCEQIAPQNLDDIAAILALYRPGPLGMGMHERYAARKAGQEPVDYAYLTTDPAEQAVIASVLDETFGTIVYQEQLMRLAAVVAGFNPGQSNKLQKAFSKKNRDEMAEVGGWFLEGGRQTVAYGGVSKLAFAEATLRTLWRTFDASADYLFNKSHAAGYGYITYVTAYLKANWPAQYGAALLSVTDDADKRLPLLNALTADGIPILAPDINLGEALTSVDRDGNVRIGLKEVKGAGEHSHAIITERDANGPFTSLSDLVNRVKIAGEDGKTSNIPVTLVQALIEAGACDSFGPRMGLMSILRAVRDVPHLPVPDIEWGVAERSRRERERLSVVISEHPLKTLGPQLRAWTEPRRGNRPIQIHRIDVGDGEFVSTLGVVASYSEKTYSKGRMASMVLEGSKGSLECVIWNRDLEQLAACDELPHVGEIVGVTGRVQVRKITLVLSDGEQQAGDDLDEDEDVDEATVVTEEIERRSLTVHNLWRGSLSDDPRILAPLADVIPLRPARGLEPKKAKAGRGPANGSDHQQVLTGMFSTTPATTGRLFADSAPAAPEPLPLPPQRRENAVEHVLIVKHGGRLLIDQLSLVLTTTELAHLAPGLADPEVLDKLGDWLISAEPGSRSDPLLCVTGDVLYLEAGDVAPRLGRVQPLLDRMRHQVATAS